MSEYGAGAGRVSHYFVAFVKFVCICLPFNTCIFRCFPFSEKRFQEANNGLSSSSGGVGKKGNPRQLVLLLSDGRFDRENKDRLRKLVREMNERGQLLVLIGE